MAKKHSVIDYGWQSGELGYYRMFVQTYGNNPERIRTELARQGYSFTQGKLASVQDEYNTLLASGCDVTWA